MSEFVELIVGEPILTLIRNIHRIYLCTHLCGMLIYIPSGMNYC